MRITFGTPVPAAPVVRPQAATALGAGLYVQHNNPGIFLLINGKGERTVIDQSGRNQRGNPVKNPIRGMREPNAACWLPATQRVTVVIDPQ